MVFKNSHNKWEFATGLLIAADPAFVIVRQDVMN